MKLKRYHIDIYCPDWSRDAILFHTASLKGVKLQYSKHARKKIYRMSKKNRDVVRNLINTVDLSDELYLDYIFEFYTNNENVVKKVCYRFPTKELDRDIILVVSSLGKIVTIYLNNIPDKHLSLDKNNYEQGEVENVK